MTTRAVVIDEAATARAAEIVAYAARHVYRPGRGDPAPGDNEKHVAFFNRVRVAFSFTHYEGELFRHISISVPKRGEYVNPLIAFALADLFGFTGWDQTMKVPEGWEAAPRPDENCIMIAQRAELPKLADGLVNALKACGVDE